MADEMMIEAILSADASGMVNGFNAASRAGAGLQKQLAPLNRLMTVTGAAFGAAGFAAVKLGKDAFDSAARVSELRVAIDAIGKATGVGGDKINEAAKKIRDNGIEMAAAQKIAITYAQNNLDLGRAADIARVAQDLAVISQRNSTDTAELLTRAIQTGNSQLLKSAGISRMAGEAYDIYAKKLGKSSTALTASERQTAVMNLIMEEGERVSGIYVAAMSEAGKVIRSFPRLYNDMQVAIGDALLKGFGPLIKGSYDLVSAFSKTVREGGALYPVVEVLGKVMRSTLDPLTRTVKALAVSVKGMDQLKISVQGTADEVQKMLPVIASFGTFLAMRVGKNILAQLPILSKFAGALNPVAGGLGVLIALSPRLRESFIKLGKAVAVLIPPLLKLVAGIADIFGGVVADIADVVAVLVGPVSAAVKIVAAGIGLIAENALILKPLIYAIGTAMMVSAVKGMFAASVASNGLAASMIRTSETIRLAGWAVQYKFKDAVAAGATGMKAFAVTAGASFKAIGMAAASMARSLVVTLAPMLALMIGFKIFKLLGDAQKQAAERSKGLKEALQENIDALKGNQSAIGDYVTSVKALGKDLLSTGEDGKKLTASLNALGLETKNVVGVLGIMKGSLADSTQARLDFMAATLRAKGVDADTAAQIARVVHENEKLGDRLFVTQEAYDGMTASAREMGDYIPEQFRDMANALEELDDQSEKTDFAKLVNDRIAEINMMSKQDAASAARIQSMARERAAQKGITDQQTIAIMTLRLLDAQFVSSADAAKKHSEALVSTAQATTNASVNFGLLVSRLKTLELAEGETKFKTEELAAALYGVEFVKAQEIERAVYGIRSSMTDLFERVDSGKGNMDVLTGAALDLGEQLTEAATTMMNLGQSEEQVAAQQGVLIDQFRQAALKAKYTDEQVDGLLQTLGILKNLRTKVQVDADLTAVQQKLSGLVAFLAKLGGDADPILKKYYYDLQQQLKALTTEQKALGEATKTYTRIQKDSKDSGSKAADAAKKLKEKMKDLREQIRETYENGIEKARENIEKITEAQQEYMQSIRETITSAATLGTAFTGMQEAQSKSADEVARQNEELTALSEEFGNAIRGAVSFTGVIDGQRAALEALNQAESRRTEVLGDVTTKQDALNALVARYERTRARAVRLELMKEIKKATEELVDAQGKLSQSDAAVIAAKEDSTAAGTTFLEGLENQVKAASKFADQLKRLRDLGLSESVLRQIAGAGAVAGGQIAEELIAGGADAIEKAKKLDQSLTTLIQETGLDLADDFRKTGATVATTLLDEMDRQVNDPNTGAIAFANKIKTLVTMGLSKENLQTVLAAGSVAGSGIADQLIAGGNDAIKKANMLQTALKDAGTAAAAAAGGVFYETGKNLATDIYNGLVAKWNELRPKLPDMTLPELQAAAKEAPKTVAAALEASNKVVEQYTKPEEIVPQIPSPPVFVNPNATTMQEAIGFADSAAFASWLTGTPTSAGLQTVAPKKKVRKFADGGIVTGPTFGLIGEAGPEAVIPLSKGMMGGGNTYNITIEGVVGMDTQRVGRELVAILQDYERRNGRVPLKAAR